MFSEFNVRAEVSSIEGLDVPSIRKARMLLRISRQARAASRRLLLLSRHHYGIGDPLCGARFREAAQRLRSVSAEVRGRARTVLSTVPESLGYGYTEQGNAYPIWNVSNEPLAGGAL